MEDLLEGINAVCITDVSTADASILEDIRQGIRDLIESYKGEVMPSAVAKDIRRAILRLVAAIAVAQSKARLQRQLDNLTAEIKTQEKKLKEGKSLSDEEQKRLHDLTELEAEARRQYKKITAPLTSELKAFMDDIIDIPGPTRPDPPPPPPPGGGRRGGPR